MNFIGSREYYTLCILALIFLLCLLGASKAKKREKPRATIETRQTDRNNDQKNYAPRYAAGSDIDSINKKAVFRKKKDYSKVYLGVLPILLSILIFRYYQLKNIDKENEFPINPFAQQEASLPAKIEQGTLECEMNSAEFDSTYEKLFVTYTYTNTSNHPCYNIKPVIIILDSNGVTIQSQAVETIEIIEPGKDKQIISSIEISSENREKASKVTMSCTFQNSNIS